MGDLVCSQTIPNQERNEYEAVAMFRPGAGFRYCGGMWKQLHSLVMGGVHKKDRNDDSAYPFFREHGLRVAISTVDGTPLPPHLQELLTIVGQPPPPPRLNKFKAEIGPSYRRKPEIAERAADLLGISLEEALNIHTQPSKAEQVRLSSEQLSAAVEKARTDLLAELVSRGVQI